MDTDQKSSALTALFTAYPPGAGESLEGLSAVYHMAIEDLPGWAVQRAVKAFIKGEIGGRNPAFRPRTAELAAEAGILVIYECDYQNGHIFAEQRRLKADGKTDYFKHRRDELVTAKTVRPDSMPALPSDNFTALIEHKTDPDMQAKLADVLPFTPTVNTTREAG